MCICDELADVQLSPMSIRKLCKLQGLHGEKVERRHIIDGRPVVLVRALDAKERVVHRIWCPGDAWYRKQIHACGEGVCESFVITEDTYKCPRKEKLRAIVRADVLSIYRLSMVEKDPTVLIMNMFDNIRAGNYLGEFSPGVLYVQEIAELFEHIFDSQVGLPTARTYLEQDARKARYSNARPLFFLSLSFAIDKAIGKLGADNTLSYAPLTESEFRTAAFFEDTLSLIEDLAEQKRIGLHGMILCTPFPDETPDKERKLLGAGNGMLIYTRDEGEFTLEVQRHYNPTHATFCIFERRGGAIPLLVVTKRIQPLFGAEFGPDMEDAARWDAWFINYIELGVIE